MMPGWCCLVTLAGVAVACSAVDGIGCFEKGKTCDAATNATRSAALIQLAASSRMVANMEADADESCYGELRAVAADEGGGVGGKIDTPSSEECKRSCTENEQCQSFAFCPHFQGCWMKTKAFSGNEPTKEFYDCWTFYRKPCDGVAPPAPITDLNFSPVDGGAGRACRGPGGQNLASYYSLKAAGSLDDCKEQCSSAEVCTGIEWNPNGRCEVWTTAIAASTAASGFECFRTGSPGTTPAPGPPAGTFQPVDGGDGRACRGNAQDDNTVLYYEVGIASSRSDCESNCLANSACTGIEYWAARGRCEVWTREEGIQSSVSAPGFACYRLVADASTSSAVTSTLNPIVPPPSPAPSPPPEVDACCEAFEQWPDMDGVSCGSCKALVLTEAYGGRCDRYCESFGHICVAAAEEVEENCQVKFEARCDEPITGTSDMLCTCWKPSATASCSPPAPTSPPPSQLTLVWSDEFDGSGPLDGSRWTYDTGGGGWGNNELQFYTDREENARRENGVLRVRATCEQYGGRDFTSARVLTKQRGDWGPGHRIDVRAKLPVGVGSWPAIWMLPTDWVYGGWPDSGEIDIMEHVGCDRDILVGTVHTGAYNHRRGTQVGSSIRLDDATAWHIYSIEWTESKILWFLDGNQYHTFETDTSDSSKWPFNQRFHLILNVAVGGDWGGYCLNNNVRCSDPAQFQQDQVMEVDFVRVYSLR